MGGRLKEFSAAIAVAAAAIFLSTVGVALAYYHTTNGVLHGLENQIWGHTHPQGGDEWALERMVHGGGSPLLPQRNLEPAMPRRRLG